MISRRGCRLIFFAFGEPPLMRFASQLSNDDTVGTSQLMVLPALQNGAVHWAIA